MFYRTIIFDCDGVVLNSNTLKTEAFRKVSYPFGEPASSVLVNYHMQNGGISRYDKFKFFLDEIVPVHAPDIVLRDRAEVLNTLLAKFASYVTEGLYQCEVASGLDDLRCSTTGTIWLIVSGGDQAELRDVFQQRELAHYFDGGIYGSPQDKHSIVADLIKNGQVQKPVLFLGDSRLDYDVAKAFGLDFIFISDWSEFSSWKDFSEENKVNVVPSIKDILNSEFFNQ